MEIKAMIENLTDNGCSREGALRARALYEAADYDGLIKYLRKCRCNLVEEMHDSQRRVDRIDYLIRQAQKEGKW
ncbi:MAG: hypothetical protein K6F28_07460 [Lachnospiraceae bacterium]|nr:hypothetical protein [Lachnospiraceae bacterium]